MGAALGSKTIGESHEIHFVDLGQYRGQRVLDHLVLQGCNPQWTPATSRLRDISSPAWQGVIRSALDPLMQRANPFFEMGLVILPRHAINPWSRFPVQRPKALLESSSSDMMQQGREPYLLTSFGRFTHPRQVGRRAGPALRPERGRLPRVLLGCSPFLHGLDRKSVV